MGGGTASSSAVFVRFSKVLGPGLQAELLTDLPRLVEAHPGGSGLEALGSWAALDRVLREVAPIVRCELGVEHFTVAATPYQVIEHRSTGSVHSPACGPAGTWGRRIEFVYVCSSGDDAYGGGTVRVHDADASADSRAEDAYVESVLESDSLLLFRSDRHVEVTRPPPRDRRSDSPGSGPFVIRGWLAGDPIGARPDLDRLPDTRTALQLRYVPRFTEHGFEVAAMPEPVRRFLEAFLALRADTCRPEGADRAFHVGDDPLLVPIADGADGLLRQFQPMHEAWAGVALLPSAAYGLRMYQPRSSLRLHADRPATHVISSVIQVSQDTDEPWPLDLVVDGVRHEVFLEPGQMVFYEGASILHGRSRPLVGRSFVNVFLHYRPTDWRWSYHEVVTQGILDGVVDRTGRPTSRPASS